MKTAEIVIRPIRNQKDYESAVKIIDSLLDCPTGSREEEILEVISILVDEYEKIHYPIGEPDPIEYLKYRMEQTNLSQKDLVKYL